MNQGEVGQYKVAYVKKNDPKTLCSDMFDSYGDALAFVEQQNLTSYFLFQEKLNNGGHYEWTILDKSLYVPYRMAWFVKQYWLEMVIVIVGVVAFVAYKKFAKAQEAVATV